MQSIVDLNGCQVEVEGETDYDRVPLLRCRDGIIVKLRRGGLNYEQISVVLNLSANRLSEIYGGIPESRRRSLEKEPLSLV